MYKNKTIVLDYYPIYSRYKVKQFQNYLFEFRFLTQ